MSHILVVHDHTGLRELMARNIEPYWPVQCVADGEGALSAVQEARPDLILAGAAGPESNVFNLLLVLQADPLTQTIPVLLVVDNTVRSLPSELDSPTVALLQTPFTAQELVGRIDAQLKLMHLQTASAQREAVLLRQAQTSQQLLEQVLASLNDHFVMFDEEWRYTYVNDAAAEVLGLPKEQLLGNSIWELFPAAVGNQFHREVHRARDEGRDVSFEHYYAPWDRWYDNRVYALPTGVSVLSIDITERKRAEAALQQFSTTLERLVAERTAELERSNRELDQFAYVISHDLKAPLRAIDNLAEWIEQDAKEALPPGSREHFAKLRRRVRRMDKLLDDMLAYSRAGRQRHPAVLVNTAALIHDIVELLPLPTGFEVAVAESMPIFRTERVPLETVLRNLIGNAIKHHDAPPTGKVTVNAACAGDWIEFVVADNGPGIEPVYHERIFEIFSTLRPRDEVEGSGMGLTVVKRIVEIRGGRVWIESTLGQGAAFHFTWPATLATPT